MPSTVDSRPVVVLGAAGFIGRALTARLAARGVAIRAITRYAVAFPPTIETHAAGTLDADTDWRRLFAGAGAVVHLASRAHAPPGGSGWLAAERDTAAAIARAAAAAGIARTIVLSSIKVLGEATASEPFSARSAPAPLDDYGWTKLAIEKAMRQQGAPGLVIVRPPLVYGPEVTGNFAALLRAVARGVPLPLAAIRNRRAFVFRDNLLALIETALTHPAAPGQAWLLRDDDEIGTPQLIREIARRLGRPARLFPVPTWLLRAAAAATGRRAAVERLVGSLSIDDSATRTGLGWRPAFSLAEGLDATCRWFAEDARRSGSRL